jgi:hypothetical protein
MNAANPFGDFANEMAVGLLSTAMRETEAPILEMAAALGRIKRTLNLAQNCATSELQNDLAICIQNLQFHDRLMQQLTTIRQLVGSEQIAGTLASGFQSAESTVELF